MAFIKLVTYLVFMHTGIHITIGSTLYTITDATRKYSSIAFTCIISHINFLFRDLRVEVTFYSVVNITT